MRPWFALVVLAPAPSFAADPDTFAVPEALPVVPVDLEAAAPAELPLAIPAAPVEAPEAPAPVEAPPVEAPPVEAPEAPAPVEAPPVEAPAPVEAPEAPAPVEAPEAPAPVEAQPVEAPETMPAIPPFEPPPPRGEPINGRWWQILHNTRTAIADGAVRAWRNLGEGVRRVGDGPSRAAPPPIQAGPAEIQAGPAEIQAGPSQAPCDCPAPAPPATCDDRHKSKRDDDPRDERRAGVWVGGQSALVGLGGGPSPLSTWDLGFHLGRRVYVSGVLGRQEAVDLSFVGVRPGVILGPTDARLRPRFDLLMGIGVYETDKVLPINVVEPRLAAELALGRWGAIDVHGGWRHVPGWQAEGLSGPTVGAGFRLGWL